MKKNVYLFLIAFFALSAANLMSQTCTVTSNDLGSGPGGLIQPIKNWKMGNSFTVCDDGIINKVKVLVLNSFSNITLEIYQGNGISGTKLGEKTGISLHDATSFTDYSEIDISDLNISVTSGSQYTFWFPSYVRIYMRSASMHPGGNYWVDDVENGGVIPITERDLYFEVEVGPGASATAPSVTTSAVSAITATTATGNGNITDLGGENATERGVYYSTTDGFADGAGTKVSTTGDFGSTGTFTQSITGLSAGTTYYVKAFATNSAGTSYGTQVSFATSKLDQTISFSALSDMTYGDADLDPGASASSTLDVSYSSSDENVATIASGKIHVVAPGNVTIYADQAGNSAYNAATQQSQSLTINPKALTVESAQASDKTYDGTTSATITGSLSGIIGEETVTLNGTGTFADANVGTAKAVTSTATLEGADAGNYSLTQPTELSADITAVPIEITADAKVKVEGQEDPALTYSITDGSLIGDDALSGELSREEGEDQGTYAILQGSLSAGLNYSISFISADFKISVITQMMNKDVSPYLIYPNPVCNTLHIEFNKLNMDKLYITDLSGKIIVEQHNLSSKTTIDVSDLKKGIYLLNIIGEEQSITKKIMKN